MEISIVLDLLIYKEGHKIPIIQSKRSFVLAYLKLHKTQNTVKEAQNHPHNRLLLLYKRPEH